MYRFFACAVFVLAFFGGASPALACTCGETIDPALTLHKAEVIFDGVVVDRDPLDRDVGDFSDKIATMRVDTVWKGDVELVVALRFNEGETSCGGAPPLGQKIRIRSFYIGPRSEVYYFQCVGLPLDDPRLNLTLAEYKARTEAFQRRADTEGSAVQFEFAQYLESNREFTRALEIHLALLDQNPDDFEVLLGAAILHVRVDRFGDGSALAKEKIATARAIASKTKEAHGKIARAEFEALGIFDETWQDWSETENWFRCEGRSIDLSDASFDNALLRYCSFAGRSLRNASFRGADLTYSRFGEADLLGAKFDCATKFRNGFDPLAAGMINVEGSCAETP